ncbi:MAG: ANTAR domain-containing protein [Acidimicrobiales bacterium]
MAKGRLSQAVSELSDALVEDYDVTGFLELTARHCSEISGVADVGVILATDSGTVEVGFSTTERMHAMEQLQVDHGQGPCMDACRTGRPELNELPERARWETSAFGDRARDAGFRRVHAIPLRLRDRVIGAVNIFDVDGRWLTGPDLEGVQMVADMATMGILQERAMRDAVVLARQLQSALDTRVVIEQAKGILAERCKLDIPGAFALLRGYARCRNLKVGAVAEEVVSGALLAEELVATAAPGRCHHR